MPFEQAIRQMMRWVDGQGGCSFAALADHATESEPCWFRALMTDDGCRFMASYCESRQMEGGQA